ncbi:MAG: Eco57I restriction-modification methylase domain-containing protein [Acidobacteriota bacterium]
MVKKLSLTGSVRVLEPCAGDGVFVDALLNSGINLSLDAYELNPQAGESLKAKYQFQENINVICDDTLTSQTLILLTNLGRGYDRIIGNPPYGAWQDFDKRKYLKKLFPNLYVKETYALFLYRCIELLRETGILVFIIPDTFLNLHRHAQLRKFILQTTCIKEICLFPSSFFPKVNFGYSNLCIITLEKCRDENKRTDNRFKVITNLKNVDELAQSEHSSSFVFKQSDLQNNIDYALFIAHSDKVLRLINQCQTRVGDVADCVTGFYSGNDKKFLRTLSAQHKNAKNYETVHPTSVFRSSITDEQRFNGIDASVCFVPIMKGGGLRYFKPDCWFMDWHVESVAHFKQDKKSRFQNSQFYFKRGVGVPMVSSSSISAALIDNQLFDQSIVGVFPKDARWLFYLLAFFNSPTCNQLIRTINPTTNNSANYIKKIPFIVPPEDILTAINAAVEIILFALKNHHEYPKNHEAEINNLIKDLYGF